MGLSSGKSIFFVILLLSLIFSSSQVDNAFCQVNRGITWFLNSNSKGYTPSLNSWQDVDLSGDTDIADGATGIVLEIVNEDSAGTAHIGQVRAKGSTDDKTSGAKIKGTTQIMAFVKLDSNKVFQAYRDNSNIKFYIRGYTGAAFVFYDNWSDVAAGHASGTTYTVWLSSIPASSTIILELYDHDSGTNALLQFARAGGPPIVARYGQGVEDTHQFIMVGVSDVSRFVHRRDTASGTKTPNDYTEFNLVGYILPIGLNNGVADWKYQPSNDISGSTTGTWTDIDVTAETASTASISFFNVQLGDTSQPKKADFRKDGSSDNQYNYGEHYYQSPETSVFYAVGLDSEQVFETQIEDSLINMYVLGYTIDILPPGAPSNPLCNGQSNPLNLVSFTPTFSWTFNDPDPGDYQDAYQIEVGTYAGGNDMWDSGPQDDTSSSVIYGSVGSPAIGLDRGITYHWHVKTWDSLGLDGPYTSDQTFKINQLPIASDLKTEGLTDPQDLKTFTPTFSWTYQDPDGDSQIQYEIEVGRSLDNDMWDPSEFSGSSTSIQYSGDPLSICEVYRVRVRVYDGFEWSNDWTQGTFQLRGATVETSTGSGIAQFDTDIGCLTQLNAVNEESLPDVGKPELDFIHGFFSIEITNLNPGDTVNVFIRLPTSMLRDTEYWGYNPSSSTWYPIPLSDDDGDNFIIIQLIDGGLGDDDPTDGVINITGGPGQPRLPPVAGVLTPMDKVSLITPFLSAALLIAALITTVFLGNRMIKNSKEVLAP